ncbi:MAG: hypothetical protein QHH74_10980 [Spirochaetota bacterium]|nr:hypothetical protein [Spirochaetota bacterium]
MKAQEFFAELEKLGGKVDERRLIAQCKLASRFFHARFEDANDPLYDSDSLVEDDTYLYVSFRALSATQFYWNGMFLDFSKEGVLKKAYRLLKGQTVYSNHDTRVENWVGVVASSKYDESVIPGINARLKLTKEFNQKIIAGIKEGAIHSASVDVVFNFEKSHPDLDDFWFLQGEEVDGQIVRVIATNIISFGELSLVWQGADSLAKRIDIQASAQGTMPDTKGGKFMKVQKQWIAQLGVDTSRYGDGDTVELSESALKDICKEAEAILHKANEKADRLEGLFKLLEIEPDESAVTLAKKDIEVARKVVEDIRNEALKFAKLSEGDALPDPIKDAIEHAGYEQASQLRDAYRAKAEKIFPLTCPHCGSIVQRARASRADGEMPNINPDEFKIQ